MAVGLRDDVLKEIVSYVMKTDSFDENLFSQTVDFILVKEQAMLEFHYKNGEVEEVLYGHPSVNSNLRWSRERKQTQSQLAKRMCKERERNG